MSAPLPELKAKLSALASKPGALSKWDPPKVTLPPTQVRAVARQRQDGFTSPTLAKGVLPGVDVVHDEQGKKRAVDIFQDGVELAHGRSVDGGQTWRWEDRHAHVSGPSWNAAVDALKGKLGVHATLDVESVPLGKIPTLAELSKLMDDLVETPNAELKKALGGLPALPIQYIKDGCYARAHVIDKLLADKGYNSAKIFAVGNLRAANEVFPEGVKWRYHVAPVVMVRNGEQVEFRVVDPSIDTEPLLADEWVRRINPDAGPVRVDLTAPEQYFPKEYSGVQTMPLAHHVKTAAAPALKKFARELELALQQP